MTETPQTTASQPSEADKDAQAGPTLYFDGSCALCTVEIGHYASRDGGDRLCFVDVSKSGVDLGGDLARETAMHRFHVRLSNGTLKSGAEGFVAIWDALPGWRWAACLARLPGMMWVLETGYRLFLPIRPVLSLAARWLGAKPANGHTSRS
ncbi:MAG: DUF393 domain-containing protein [Pseudomonadota bacterium]